MSRNLFAVGKVVATPGALETRRRSGQSPFEFLARHAALDRGELDAEDHATNRRAVRDGCRIFSSYKTCQGDKLWVITEGDRSSTCILLPEEY
jgi:hypothetical protein